MKNHDLNPTRLVCRMARWSNALTEGALRGNRKSAAHVATCEDCQKFYAANDELESALRESARETDRSTRDGLEERILRGVRGGRIEPRRTVRFGHPLIPLATVAAGVVLAIFLLGRMPPKHNEVSRPLVAKREVIAPATPGNSWTWSVPAPLRFAVDGNPLQNELDSVYSDAESALNFLALNFLPSASSGSPNDRANGRAVHSG
jgi:hypothetical protein